MAANDVRTGRFNRVEADGEVAVSALLQAGTLRTCVIKVYGGGLCIGPTGLNVSNAMRLESQGWPQNPNTISLEPGALAANVFVLAIGTAPTVFEILAEYSA